MRTRHARMVASILTSLLVVACSGAREPGADHDVAVAVTVLSTTTLVEP